MRDEVAIVHDYLTQRGGAERVVLSMCRAFPDAPVYTSVYDPAATFDEFRDVDVRTLWMNRIPSLRADHRRGLPLYPAAFSTLEVDADLVICSSSGFAHGAKTRGRKAVYCYTPPRWLYDDAASYLDPLPWPIRTALRATAPVFRRWDRRAVASADLYLTTSTFVQARIRRDYGIEAEVLPPATSMDPTAPQQRVVGCRPGFVLSAARLLGYKNVDAVVRAFERLPDVQLVVAGTGPETPWLERMAPPNVHFAGCVSDAELRWLYAHCSVLVTASLEDFGLTPLEAAAWGKPSAVLEAGGFLDTVCDGVTGRFFAEPDPEQIAPVIASLLADPLPTAPILAHHSQYNEQAFVERLRGLAQAFNGAR